MRRIFRSLPMLTALVLVAVVGASATRASTSGSGIFHTTCGPTSHALPDDPIVRPGLPGASHIHDFFGNNTTNANSTFASLRAATSNCSVSADRSGYWVPQLYYNGQAVDFTESQAYYDGEAQTTVATPPPGLELIGGSAVATAPLPTYEVKWTCDGNAGVPGASSPPTFCPAGTKLKVVVKTPNCLETSQYSALATATDPPHVNSTHFAVYAAGSPGSVCPSGYTALPTVRIEVKYPITGTIDPNLITLSSGCGPAPCKTGGWWTMHGDFFNAWDPPTLADFVQGCINKNTDCGTTAPATTTTTTVPAPTTPTTSVPTTSSTVATPTTADTQPTTTTVLTPTTVVLNHTPCTVGNTNGFCTGTFSSG